MTMLRAGGPPDPAAATMGGWPSHGPGRPPPPHPGGVPARQFLRRLARKLARRLAALLPAQLRRLRLIDRLSGHDDALLRLLFDDPAAGAALIDRDGRLLRMNTLLRKLLASAGASRPSSSQIGAPQIGAPLIGASAALLFEPSGRAAAWEAISRQLGAQSAAPEAFASGLAGAEEAVSVSVSVIALRESDRSVSGAILRFSDISVQKRLEVQLAQGQKLQAVGQLAGGIAHDFNNLLTAVLGAADSIAQHAGLDDEIREDIEQIRTSAGRGAALVRQLLAFGRQQTLQPRVVSVNHAIADLTTLLRRLLGESIRLELELEPPGRSVRVDPSQLDQVLVNLAVNARDAMPRGGTLTLRSGHITLFRPLSRGAETIPPGRYVMIEVADTGIGIPPELLGRVFDPFFTTKRDGSGHGLGLSTVHGIIRQSGGYLGVASELGVGTRMRIYLPRWDDPQTSPTPLAASHPFTPPITPPVSTPPMSQPATETALTVPPMPVPPPPAPAAAAGQPPPGRVVLLVEDEAAVRHLAARSLTRNGWTVLAAGSGEEALALLGDPPRRIAAVVTDMVMPGMDGAALLRAVRERLALPALPGILVSGYAEETLRQQMGVTATAFLPKPYSLKDLAARVAAVALPD